MENLNRPNLLFPYRSRDCSATAFHHKLTISRATGGLTTFVGNAQPGSTTKQGDERKGIEHPLDVKFGLGGALYTIDYGRVELDRSKQGVPFNFVKGSGVIWKASKI